jgi:hypothetical protein
LATANAICRLASAVVAAQELIKHRNREIDIAVLRAVDHPLGDDRRPPGAERLGSLP